MTVRFEVAPPGSTGLTLSQILDRPDVAQVRTYGGLLYAAIAVPEATHRLAIPATEVAERYCCTIDPDPCAALRLDATARLFGHLGLTSQSVGERLAPTRFQQRRLTLLLAILDRLASAREPPATVRAVATELVYRNMGHQSAAAWKASSQRRQTQRLIAEARAMMVGGYRAVLMGNILKSRG